MEAFTFQGDMQHRFQINKKTNIVSIFMHAFKKRDISWIILILTVAVFSLPCVEKKSLTITLPETYAYQ